MLWGQVWTRTSAKQRAEAEMTQEERLVQAAQLAGTRHPSQVRPPPPHPSRVALLASLQNQGSGPAGMESHPNIWARTLQQEPLLLLLKPQGGTRLGRTWGPRGSSWTTLQVMPSSQVLSEKVCSAPLVMGITARTGRDAPVRILGTGNHQPDPSPG